MKRLTTYLLIAAWAASFFSLLRFGFVTAQMSDPSPAFISVDNLPMRADAMQFTSEYMFGADKWVAYLLIIVTELALLREIAAHMFTTGTPRRTRGIKTLTTALTVTAIWPWLIDSAPYFAVLLSFVAAGFAAYAYLNGHPASRGGKTWAPGWGMFAGWTILMAGTFSMALAIQIAGLDLITGLALSVAICTAVTIVLQLRLRGGYALTATMIWGLIALTAMAVSITTGISAIAIAGILALSMLLVERLT